MPIIGGFSLTQQLHSSIIDELDAQESSGKGSLLISDLFGRSLGHCLFFGMLIELDGPCVKGLFQ